MCIKIIRELFIEAITIPAIGFPYLSRKTLATATRYLYFGEKEPNLRFLLRTLMRIYKKKRTARSTHST